MASRAHLPTYAPARGGEEQGGNRMYKPSVTMSAKDMPSHTKLKYRTGHQVVDKDARGMQEKLQEKETLHLKEKNKFNFEEEKARDLELLQAAAAPSEAPRLIPKAADADDADDASSSESDSDDDDDEDEEAALLAELAKIKKEREEERLRAEAEEREREEQAKREQAMTGNPLLGLGGGGGGGLSLKRKWYEDTVFRNQARGEPKPQRRFINDTVRSDFHKKFLERYIK